MPRSATGPLARRVVYGVAAAIVYLVAGSALVWWLGFTLPWAVAAVLAVGAVVAVLTTLSVAPVALRVAGAAPVRNHVGERTRPHRARRDRRARRVPDRGAVRRCGPCAMTAAPIATCPRGQCARLVRRSLTVATLVLAACDAPMPDSEEPERVSGREIALDGLGRIGGLTWHSDSTIAVLDRQGEPFVTIVDVGRGEVVARGVRSGGGPGEVRAPDGMWRTDDGALALLEPNRRGLTLVADVGEPDRSRFVELPRPTRLPPTGVVRSTLGTLLTGEFGDTTILFVPTANPDAMRAAFEGPHRRTELEPALVFDANRHAFTLDELTGRAALAFAFAPSALVVDSLGHVLHSITVGATGFPRRASDDRNPNYVIDRSDVASMSVALRGNLLAVAYCGCLGADMADSLRTVLLFDLDAPGQPVRFVLRHRIVAVALSLDGRRLAVGFNDPEPHLELFEVRPPTGAAPR